MTGPGVLVSDAKRPKVSPAYSSQTNMLRIMFNSPELLRTKDIENLIKPVLGGRFQLERLDDFHDFLTARIDDSVLEVHESL